MFEFFEKPSQPIRQADEPLAEITRGGRIRLNSKASQEFLPAGQFVRLAYNREEHTIGIVLAKEFDPKRTMKIHWVARGREVSIAAKPYFDLFGIELPSGGIKDLPVSSRKLDEDTDIVVIQLPRDQ